MKKLNERGLGVIVIVMVIGVFGIICLAGWQVYSTQSKDSQANNETVKPVIQKADDLDKQVDNVNAHDIDKELDTSDIDASLQ